MLLEHPDDVFKCLLAFFAITFIISAYTYITNSRRAPGDPKKQNYHYLAIVLAPITLPFFLALAIFGFILLALLYAVVFVFFAILVVILRKPFLLDWLRKFTLSIGDPLLRANTALVRRAISF